MPDKSKRSDTLLADVIHCAFSATPLTLLYTGTECEWVSVLCLIKDSFIFLLHKGILQKLKYDTMLSLEVWVCLESIE